MGVNDRRDAELVELASAGDQRAFTELDRRWRPQLITFVTRYLPDPDTRTDVVQITLSRAFTRLHQYRRDASWGAWLRAIAKRATADVLKQQRARRVDDAAEVMEIADRRASTDGRVLRRELHGRIAETLSRIPEHYRTALILADEEDRPYAEIARIMGISEGTVKTRVFRARAAFAAHFGQLAA